MRTIITTVLFLFSTITFGYAQVCNISSAQIDSGHLAHFDKNWNLISKTGNRKKITVKTDSKKTRLGLRFTNRTKIEAGMYLVKFIDMGKDKTNEYPDEVNISRTKSKRFAYFGKFKIKDLPSLHIDSSSVKTLQYQLAHLIVNELNLTGVLKDFHRSYASGGMNKKTFHKELESRIKYAFKDIKLNLPKDKRKVLNLALNNISDSSYFVDAVAKEYGFDISQGPKPALTSKSQIKKLEARHFYYGPQNPGSHLNICIYKSVKPGTVRSTVEVYQLNPEDSEKKKIPKLVNEFVINWI